MTFPPYDLDDDLVAATASDGVARVRVLVPGQAMAVLGRGSKAALELDLGACEAGGVPVLRRPGGGCAVLLDPGNVVVSLVLAVEGIGRNKEHFARISAWLLRALDGLGLEALSQQGISDLSLGELKVGGSCIQRSRGLLYYSTTLLVDPDVALMSRCLRHPPREPEYRAGRSHEEFVGQLNFNGRAPALAHALRGALDPAALEATLP